MIHGSKWSVFILTWGWLWLKEGVLTPLPLLSYDWLPLLDRTEEVGGASVLTDSASTLELIRSDVVTTESEWVSIISDDYMFNNCWWREAGETRN